MFTIVGMTYFSHSVSGFNDCHAGEPKSSVVWSKTSRSKLDVKNRCNWGVKATLSQNCGEPQPCGTIIGEPIIYVGRNGGVADSVCCLTAPESPFTVDPELGLVYVWFLYRFSPWIS